MGRYDIIKQYINIDNHWLVIVYYNIDYNQFYIMKDELLDIGSPVEEIDEIYHALLNNEVKAFTATNSKQHTSIVGVTTHNDKSDYMSSLVHEAKHITDDIMKEYNITNYGEPPAYTIGYIVKRMYNCLSNIGVI